MASERFLNDSNIVLVKIFPERSNSVEISESNKIENEMFIRYNGNIKGANVQPLTPRVSRFKGGNQLDLINRPTGQS